MVPVPVYARLASVVSSWGSRLPTRPRRRISAAPADLQRVSELFVKFAKGKLAGVPAGRTRDHLRRRLS